MKNILRFLVVAFCLFTTMNSLHAQWVQSTGMATGQGYALAVLGNDLFAGTYTGAYLSTDSGLSWTAVNSGLDLWTLAVSGTNLFAGDADGGVRLSTNNGTSWTAVYSGLADPQGSALAVSGTNIFYGTGGGVFLSTDNGSSWTAVDSGLTNLNVVAFAVSGANIFAGTYGGGVFLSTNNGTTWTGGITPGLAPNNMVYSLAVSGTNLFAGTYYYGVFLSTNNGTSWSADTLGMGNTFVTVLSLAVSGTNIFAGTLGKGLYLSTNNGTSWTAVNSGLPSNSDVRALAVFGRNLIAGTDEGFWWRPLAQMMVFLPPTNLSVEPGNTKISLSWTASTLPHLAEYRIYRGTASNAVSLSDSCTTTSFVDSALANGTTYYYKVTAVDSLYGESGFSNEVSSAPYNQPPVAASLASRSLLNTGRVLTSSVTFSSSGSHDPDGTVDSTIWYVNSLRVGTDSTLTYDFGLGTSRVTLVVVDNQGARDSSVAYVNRAAYVTTLGGPVTSGLSMLGSNVLYAIASGDAVYRLDSNETLVYKLYVVGSGGSSCSIGYDSTVYISSSDNNLYAFSKNATSVWTGLPLGGNASATPTIDSALQRIYIGVSNRNFLCFNRLTGGTVWNWFTGSPTSNSAVISSDGRLVFPTHDGTLYGVDLEANDAPSTTTWLLTFPDSLPTSPAIDQYGNFYFGTTGGNLYAVSMVRDEQATHPWSLHLGGQLLAEPVIDANGVLYIGSTDSTMYAVNLVSKSIGWRFKTNGSIRYTAAISQAGYIYFDNDAGVLYCLDNSGNIEWSFNDPGDGLQVTGPILYNSGMAYAGAGPKSVIALYDGKGIQSSSSPPIWGTFQGNNQRTGVQPIPIVSSASNGCDKTPISYALYANYPNPCNPTTIISYDIPKLSHVTLVIYDILGRQVGELVRGEKSPGHYQATFDAGNLPSGVYFYRLQAGTYSNTKKLLLLK
jgi:hypothetical protein